MKRPCRCPMRHLFHLTSKEIRVIFPANINSSFIPSNVSRKLKKSLVIAMISLKYIEPILRQLISHSSERFSLLYLPPIRQAAFRAISVTSVEIRSKKRELAFKATLYEFLLDTRPTSLENKITRSEVNIFRLRWDVIIIEILWFNFPSRQTPILPNCTSAISKESRIKILQHVFESSSLY